MRIPLLPGLGALGALLLVLSAGPTPEVAAAPEGTLAVARALGKPAVHGTLTALDATQVTVAVRTGTAETLAVTQMIELALPTRPVERDKGAWTRLSLGGGSTLVGRITGGDQDLLRIDSPSLGKLELLLDHVLTLEALSAKPDPCRDLAATHPKDADGDIAYDTTGDEYRGTALEVGDEGLVMETAGRRERTVPWTSLRVLHLENSALDPNPALHAEVEMQDGSRLMTTSAPTLEDGVLVFSLRSLPKQARRVPLERVRFIRWYGGAFDHASKLAFTSRFETPYEEPEGSRVTPQLAQRLGARVDRRSSGCPLRMGGRTFRHGFGVNSKSTITIPLAGKYATFRTWFGIDDETRDEAREPGMRGLVDARIRVDGKVVWEAKRVVQGEAAREIGPIDVKGARTLVLEVGFGDEIPKSNTLDRADWGEPLLVKSTE